MSPASEVDFVVLGGGLARTLSFGDYRFDIGGHRYHSAWPEVTAWVLDVLDGDVLDVSRRSRIRLDGRYVDFPLQFPNALTAFSPPEATRILASYLKAHLWHSGRRLDVSFDDWVERRFGRALYDIYFRPYTEKVWGLDCTELSADWASQRIGLPSLSAAVRGSLRRSARPATLVSRFLYPPLGIGALPERIAAKAQATGRATVHTSSRVSRLEHDPADGWGVYYDQAGRQVVSTIPLEALLRSLPLPAETISALSHPLAYRGVRCVFLAVDGPRISPDTWTYLPDPGLTLGRTHEPPNWSPQMAPPGQTSLCVEVFCSAGDEIWHKPDGDLVGAVVDDLDRLGFLSRSRVREAWGLRASHAYPIYRVGYAAELHRVREALTRWPTLHLAGRTGTFEYLNMDAVIRQAIQLADTLCEPA